MTVDRSKAPDIHTVQEIKPLVYQKLMLSREIPLFLTEHGESNLFKLVLRFDGGISEENKPLEAQFAVRMLLEGTKRKSAGEIALLLDFFSASIKTIAERDYISVEIQGLRKDFQGIMDVVMELIHDSVLPQKEFELLKNRIYNQFKTNIQRKSYQAQNEIKPLLFGEKHAYGHKLSNEVFQQITRDEVMQYYHRVIQNGHLRIFISGIENKEAETFLNSRTGNLYPSKFKALSAPVFPDNKRQVHHLQYDDAVQSAIRLGLRLHNRTHPDFMELKILNTILGGYFGSRLMKNLREDKGLTYGVGSAIGSARQSGLWIIATEVGAEYTQKALSEIYKEINNLKTSLVSDEELQLIQHYLPGKILRALEKDFDKLDSFIELSDHQLPENYYSSFLKAINNITAERIKEIANQYLMFDDISEVVVGKT